MFIELRNQDPRRGHHRWPEKVDPGTTLNEARQSDIPMRGRHSNQPNPASQRYMICNASIAWLICPQLYHNAGISESVETLHRRISPPSQLHPASQGSPLRFSIAPTGKHGFIFGERMSSYRLEVLSIHPFTSTQEKADKSRCHPHHSHHHHHHHVAIISSYHANHIHISHSPCLRPLSVHVTNISHSWW